MTMGGEDHSAAQSQLTCPSAPATPGSWLLGIVGSDGRIANLRTLMRLDEAFLQAARAAGPPEARMRFANRCQISGCKQWTGHSCGVIERVMERVSEMGLPQPRSLQPCTIRSTCRWYAQAGPEACAACALVVTDSRNAA